jgi:hypothetical protein
VLVAVATVVLSLLQAVTALQKHQQLQCVEAQLCCYARVLAEAPHARAPTLSIAAKQSDKNESADQCIYGEDIRTYLTQKAIVVYVYTYETRTHLVAARAPSYPVSTIGSIV